MNRWGAFFFGMLRPSVVTNLGATLSEVRASEIPKDLGIEMFACKHACMQQCKEARMQECFMLTLLFVVK